MDCPDFTMSCQENICRETWLTIKCEKLPDGCREQNSNDRQTTAETLNKDFKLFITGLEEGGLSVVKRSYCLTDESVPVGRVFSQYCHYANNEITSQISDIAENA